MGPGEGRPPATHTSFALLLSSYDGLKPLLPSRSNVHAGKSCHAPQQHGDAGGTLRGPHHCDVANGSLGLHAAQLLDLTKAGRLPLLQVVSARPAQVDGLSCTAGAPYNTHRVMWSAAWCVPAAAHTATFHLHAALGM